MKISVIIPVFKSNKTLHETLNSLKQQSVLFDEIIVVVNGENLSIYQSLVSNFPGVQFLHINEPNRARARNIGINKALGQYIVFLDADTCLDSGWNKKVKLKIQDFPYLDGLVSKIIPVGTKKSFLNLYRTKYRSWVSNKTFLSVIKPSVDRDQSFRVAPVINTAACIYKKKTLLFFGGFDEDFIRGEDEELSRRLYYKGAWLGTCEEALAYVYNGESRLEIIKYLFRYIEIGRASAILSLKLKTGYPILSKRMLLSLYKSCKSIKVTFYHLLTQLIYLTSFYIYRVLCSKKDVKDKFYLNTKFAQYKALSFSKKGFVLNPYVRLIFAMERVYIEIPNRKDPLVFEGTLFNELKKFLKTGHLSNILKENLLKSDILITREV